MHSTHPLATGATLPAPGLQSVLDRHGADPHALVQILREMQALQGWLPRASLAELAARSGLTLAQVEGVAGFYRFFHTRPVGRYRVLFSDNITDRMLGSEALMADLCQRLGVAPGRAAAPTAWSAWTAPRAPACATRARRCWSITTTW